MKVNVEAARERGLATASAFALREFTRRFWVCYQKISFETGMVGLWRVQAGILHLNAEAISFFGEVSDGRVNHEHASVPEMSVVELAEAAAKAGLINAFITEGPMRSVWAAPILGAQQRRTDAAVVVSWSEEVVDRYCFSCGSNAADFGRVGKLQ